MKNIAIIGAGLSGLSLAELLAPHAKVTVFEKSRGVGGRMSTRRINGFVFNHGAQYFTARSREFKEFLSPLITQGVVVPWRAKLMRIDAENPDNAQVFEPEHPRYISTPAMNSWLKSLDLAQVELKLGARVGHAQHDKQWRLYGENGEDYGKFDWLISSAPASQSRDLLPSSLSFHNQISDIELAPCFSLMLGFEADLQCDYDAAQVSNSLINWFSLTKSQDNGSIHNNIVIQSTADYAERQQDAARENVLQELLAAAQTLLPFLTEKPSYQSLHFWRYAKSDSEYKAEVKIDRKLQVAVCGDWLEKGHVEAAYISALKLSRVIQRELLKI